jgi:hypothetical protein
VKEAFDKILLDAVDGALASLGDSARQAIYFHLESKFRVVKKEIPDHVEGFEAGLEKIFGAGAKFIEILIMKKLYERVGQPLEWDESKQLDFVGYVTIARKAFMKSEKN